MFIDTHLHINRKEFNNESADVVNRAISAGVTRFMNVGYDIESSKYSVDLSARDKRFYAAVGVHPHDALLIASADEEINIENLNEIKKMAKGAVAIGEIGLDYFRDLSPRPAQRAAFSAQLELATELNMPVVLHIRDAYDEAIGVLEKTGLPPKRGIMHSFAGDMLAAEWAVENGFLLGIGGPVTYRNSKLFESVKLVGAENIVLETDAPWLPPVPHRGKRNEPSYLVHTAEHVAQLLELPLAELASVTATNFLDLIGASGE
ncbi:MAG: TatD family hydrolase [bacterium]|nr:TatD family hydrolase [bacterium]MCP4800977.1 TatD family hydrolase [bacterium]